MTDPHAGLQTPADSGRGPNAASATQVAEPIQRGAQAISADPLHNSVVGSGPDSIGASGPVRELCSGHTSRWPEGLAALRGSLERRDGLLTQLLFAAQQHAAGFIHHRAETPNVKGIFRCEECRRFATDGDALDHEDHCKAGRVLALLSQLQALGSLQSAAALEDLDFNPDRKEAARIQEADRAGQGKSPRGLFGEPWDYRLDDVLQTVTIYDCEGTQIVQWPVFNQEIIDWAARTIDCVNSCAGMDDEVLRKALGGDYFLVRVQCRDEFNGFVEAWAAKHCRTRVQEFSSTHTADSSAMDELFDACQAQHVALDAMFARVAELDGTFLPSKSGQPWSALLQGVRAVRRVAMDRMGIPHTPSSDYAPTAQSGGAQ